METQYCELTGNVPAEITQDEWNEHKRQVNEIHAAMVKLSEALEGAMSNPSLKSTLGMFGVKL